MFTTVFLGFLFLLVVGSLIFLVSASKAAKEEREWNQKNPDAYHKRDGALVVKRFAWGSLVASLVLFLIVGAASTVKLVGPTEVGVPVSFGSVGTPIQSGVNFTAPWVEVETYPTRPVTVELSGDQRILARTADAGQMQVEVAARWKVLPADAKNLFMQVRTGDDDRISQDIVVKNLRQAVGSVYSVTGNLDALNDRTKTTQAIKDQLQEQLSAYGIQIEDVNLRSVEPDEKTANTIALYASQQQATRIAEEAKKTATIESQRRLIEAQGLEQSSNAVAGIDADSAKILCMQIWQQVVSKGIESGTPVYTNPCGADGNVSVITSAPPQ
jgi:regulator of protease activity HflC (stomatin/prohibitin superfamily)